MRIVDRLRRALSAAALFACSVALPAHAAGFDLDELTALLARVRSGEATFVERREVSVLDRTVMTSGRLSFQAPDTFVRENLKPLAEKVAVVGDTVTMSRGGRSHTVTLDSVPEAAVIIEAIRGTLTGNREALRKLFETRVGGDAKAWTLDLVPRDVKLRAQVSTIRVSGRQSQVREVLITLPDGDKTTMTIEPTSAPAGAASGASSGAASAAASGAAR
jgi:outer membrane lipoprotein-sorting protein